MPNYALVTFAGDAGHYRLSVRQLTQTEIYMLNDRPFYLIREVSQPGRSVWQDLKHFHLDERQKVKAILFYNHAGHEVFLSDFQLHDDVTTYAVAPATTRSVQAFKGGEMQLFMNTTSKPLCNLINEQMHAEIELAS